MTLLAGGSRQRSRLLAIGLFRALLVAALLLLGACAAKPPAEVRDRSSQAGQKPVPAGHYRVRSGDTLYGIAFGRGLDYQDLAAWNGLSVPYVIYPGQDLRLSRPPGQQKPASRPPAVVTTKPIAPPRTTTRPTESTPAPARTPAPAKGTTAPPTGSNAGEKPAPAQTSPGVRWDWPVRGRVVRGFLPGDPSRNGIDIASPVGSPVNAAADGTVVYSGNGLIGYGELIIVKHDEQWLSAYGHNRKRLVAEGERVRRGQQIAELGRNDRNEQVLHFEIRSNGKPVDPRQYLPTP